MEWKLLVVEVAIVPNVSTVLESLTILGRSYEKNASSGAVADSFLHCLMAFKDSVHILGPLSR